METRKVNVMGKEVQIPKDMTFGELAKEFEGEVFGKILVAKQGNSLRELICPIRTDEDITFLDFRDKEGVRVYERGISLLLVKAVRDVLGTATGVEIEHSLRGNLYCELRSPQQVPDADLLAKIEARMKEYVAADTPIVKHVCPREVAISIVKEQGLQDKVELFRYRTASNINLYELDGFYDYFFGYMPDSVGALEWFTLMPFETGFLVRFPDPAKTGDLLPEEQPRKISKVFLEQMHWCQLMQVRNVAELNRTIVEGKFGDLIRVNEALHEKKIAEIADQIHQRMDKVRVVLIAGPSSSGKTSFANRLCIQLRALGVNVHIATDDGSAGLRGLVTDAMDAAGDGYTYLYTCGPEPMLRAVYDRCRTDGQFSFEERMGCGFGACMGCSCKTKYGTKRICKDGPVLRKGEIVW